MLTKIIDLFKMQMTLSLLVGWSSDGIHQAKIKITFNDSKIISISPADPMTGLLSLDKDLFLITSNLNGWRTSDKPAEVIVRLNLTTLVSLWLNKPAHHYKQTIFFVGGKIIVMPNKDVLITRI